MTFPLDSLKQFSFQEILILKEDLEENNKIKWLRIVLNKLQRVNELAESDLIGYNPICVNYKFKKEHLNVKIKLYTQFLIDTFERRIYPRLNKQKRETWDCTVNEVLNELKKYKDKELEHQTIEWEENHSDDFYNEY